MKLPHDLSGEQVGRALSRLGFEFRSRLVRIGNTPKAEIMHVFPCTVKSGQRHCNQS